MKFVSILALLLLLAVNYRAATAADEFPFTGYAISTPRILKAEEIRSACALYFFVQTKDDHSDNYVADTELFKSDGRVHFLKSATANCTFRKESMTEDCSGTIFRSTENKQITYFTKLELVSEDEVAAAYFDDAETRDTFAAANLGASLASLSNPSIMHMYRCPDHDELSLRPYIDVTRYADSTQSAAVDLGVYNSDPEFMQLGAKIAKILKPKY